MAIAGAALGNTTWDLPPLILHPFNERVPPADLLESSRAALTLSGLLAGDGSEADELQRRVLTGRYTEIRMLYFIGKDVFRWIDQSVERVNRIPELIGLEIHAQSMAGLLTGGPPIPVQKKLTAWGVADYQAIFSRAIGLYSAFRQPPGFEVLSDHFLGHYHKCADHLFQCYMEMRPHLAITVENFRFELYASGEYSRMLEAEWGGK